VLIGRRVHATQEPLISRAMLAAVPLAGLSFFLRVDPANHGDIDAMA